MLMLESRNAIGTRFISAYRYMVCQHILVERGGGKELEQKKGRRRRWRQVGGWQRVGDGGWSGEGDRDRRRTRECSWVLSGLLSLEFRKTGKKKKDESPKMGWPAFLFMAGWYQLVRMKSKSLARFLMSSVSPSWKWTIFCSYVIKIYNYLVILGRTFSTMI